MPVAYIQEFAPTGDQSTTNYDAISQQLGFSDENPPAGLLVHTAGFGEDGSFRIYDVWATREDAERFQREQLAPLLEPLIASGQAGPEPAREELYDLHRVVRGAR